MKAERLERSLPAAELRPNLIICIFHNLTADMYYDKQDM